jgi:HPt (histidine-containing phosphotransfer) domain-containing protein
MSVKTSLQDQFIILLTGDTVINTDSLDHSRQKICVINNPDDLIRVIATTHFDLILLDITANSSTALVPDRLHEHQALITLIKDPLCINNNTPIVTIIKATELLHGENQHEIKVDGSLIKPITEEQLNKTIDLWQTKAFASAYIQILMNKTKNNQQLALTLFEKLFEELPLQMTDIKNAIEDNQHDLAQAITHKLNGSASFCGFIEIQQPANALECALINDNYTDIPKNLLTLQQHILNLTHLQTSIIASLGQG